MIKSILVEIAKLTTANINNNIPAASGISRVLNHFQKLKLINKDFNSVYIHTIVAFSDDVTNPDLIKYFCNEDIIELFEKRVFETDKDEFKRVTDSVLHRCGLLGLKEYKNIKQFQPKIDSFIEYFEELVNLNGTPLLLKMYNSQKETEARQQEEIYKNTFEFQSEEYLKHLIKEFNKEFPKKKYIHQKGKKKVRCSKKSFDSNHYSNSRVIFDKRGDKHFIEKVEGKMYISKEKIIPIPIIDHYINIWINDDTQNFLAIMGEYGTGKTSLCKHIANELALSYSDKKTKIINDKHKRIIFLLNLRNFKAEDVEKYIIAELNENGIQDFNKPNLYSRIDNKELIFIFDGFDEMTLKIEIDEKIRNFNQIQKLVESSPRSKIILTSREEYFTSDAELNKIFSIKEKENYGMIYLNLFDKEQIKAYLTAYTDDPNYYLKEFKRIYDLEDLAQRPVLLDFIIKYLPGLIEEKGRNKKINASDLYKTGIEKEMERLKGKISDIDKKIPKKKRLKLLQKLSIYIYENNEYVIDTKLMKEILDLQKFFNVDEEDERKYLNDFLNFSFLSKEGNDIYKISHKSFRDYLVATELVKEINSDKINIFGKYQTSAEINHFISEMKPHRTKLEKYVRDTTESNETTKWQKSNAVNIILKMDNPQYKRKEDFNEKEIYLSHSNLSNISILKELKNLTGLLLTGNQITDLEPLKELSNLNNIRLDDNQIINLDSLSELKNLHALYSSGNLIIDLYPLRKLVNLEKLYLYNNNINNIDILTNLNNLKELSIVRNQILDFKPLTKLTKLNLLFLSENQINNLELLSQLKNLKYLRLNKNRISYLEPLNELRNLTELELKYNQITDLEPLKELKNLTDLRLDYNKITNLEPLKEMKKLIVLWLNENQITDLEPLKELKSLTELYLSRNQITDLEPLKELKKLTYLDLHDSPLQKSQIEELRKALPKTDIIF